MRLRRSVIGALNLFRIGSGEMGSADVEVAQAFADVATIAILQHRAALEAHVINAALRSHARDHNLRLAEVAAAVISGTLRAPALDPPPLAEPQP